MSSVKTYKNPIYRGADPFILTHEGKYYLYATNAASEGYKVAQSDDLVNWEDKGFCLKKGDVKGELVYSADGKWCYGFWAPEVMYYKGKFYMIYTVDNHIGIAEADSPLGPFTQKEHKWIVDSKAIDGSFFVDGTDRMLSVDEIMQNREVILSQPDYVRTYQSARWPYEDKIKGCYNRYFAPGETQCLCEYSLMDADEYSYEWKSDEHLTRDGMEIAILHYRAANEKIYGK